MKILHLLSSGGFYGKEAVVLTLCSELGKLGHTAGVGAFLNARAPNQEVVNRAHREGLQASMFECAGRVDVRTVSQIREHILSQQIDLIHSHDYKADLYGFLAGRWTGRPVFATCHLWFGTTFSDRIYSGLDRFVLRYFDGVIGVAPHIVERLHKSWVPKCKVRVIPNGIDFKAFMARNELGCGEMCHGDPTIGIVGRLSRQKGHAVLFAAARGILKRFPEAKFKVVGEGPDRTQLEAMVDQMGIGRNVEFAGFCDDMPALYSGLDLLVMPSLDEGLPIALLEAMAAGLAVIASSVGAIPSVVDHGKSGLLVQPGDVLGLEQAMLELLDDASLRTRLAANARQSVTRFSSERMARNYLDFYQLVGRLPVGAVVTA
jgi:glycosyltransferase involved in cell wall biosynthesis